MVCFTVFIELELCKLIRQLFLSIIVQIHFLGHSSFFAVARLVFSCFQKVNICGVRCRRKDVLTFA